ncbi:hypothetical protein GCM10010377_80710 [Streptomyces viridiviolaceus]|uniref:Bulb-type lectin domain-containing protein n=1 Tax=Streptomyces viridiviolaceus TaxID=68282 RepID=A0ABW2EBD5_9ACTN|nr:hypothetical protein [Streptomyces viridiviolaceus]GHB78409.1 hypothetical protein GCM10010377_80710 [Streptomyces viridiviolaceus]
MNHPGPGAGHPHETTGATAGQAVWDSELPWQLASAGDVGAAVPRDGAGPAPDETLTGQYTHPAVSAPVPAQPGDDPFTARRRYPAEETGRRAGGRRTSVQPSTAGERRGGSRARLAKPVLAGAGVLSALFLLGPALFGENGPSQTVQAGAGDLGEDYTPDEDHPSVGGPEQPRPVASGSPDAGSAAGARQDRIAAVAAASPTQETHTLEATPERDTPSPLETSRAAETPRASPSPQEEEWTSTVVHGTSVLEPGQSWVTNRITLAFQGDGNLVLYDRQGTPLWWSGTVGQGVKTVFQADGNLVVYTQDGQTAWASRTMGHDGAQLVLEPSGNVSIRYGGSVLWSTHTAM